MLEKIDVRFIFNVFVVFYAFVLPLSRASVSIATVAMVMLFFLQNDKEDKIKQIIHSQAAVSILLFVLLYCLSMLFVSGEQLKSSVGYLVPYLYLLPSVIIMVMVDGRTIPIVMVALFSGIAVSEIISYGIFFGIWEKSRVLMQNPSPFMHHIQYSTFLAFSSLMLLYLALQTKKVSYKIFASLFSLILIVTLFLINGRTGQVAFLFGLLVLGLTHFQNRLKALLISSALIILIIGSAYGLSDNFKDRISVAQSDIAMMIDEKKFNTSLGYRVGATILSFDLIKQNPLFGTGIANSMDKIKMEAKKSFPNDYFLQRANHLQNQYLQVAVELGILGLFMFVWMLYAIANIPIYSDTIRTMKIILVSIYVLTMLSDIQLHIQFTAGLFALITGLVLAQSRIESEDNKTKYGAPNV
jgi:O-antigen ligase